MTEIAEIELLVNGQTHRVNVPPDTPLLEVLRDELGLTGTKYGCGEGQCGACTVSVGGEIARACVTDVSQVGNLPVLTIEGLAQGTALHPLQQAFLDESAMQCAYCVSGMIMAAHALLDKIPHPTHEEINEHMQRNLCRCGCYPNMQAAIARAAERMRGGK